MFIEIERISEDKLSSHYWRFNADTQYSSFEISVWTYAKRIRRTIRCKWVNEEIFTYLDRRNNTLSSPDVYLPCEVQDELKAKLIKIINDTPIRVELDR